MLVLQRTREHDDSCTQQLHQYKRVYAMLLAKLPTCLVITRSTCGVSGASTCPACAPLAAPAPVAPPA